MDVFESAPVVANHVPMDHEADLVPHIGMGKDVKPSDVHEQRDQVGIHNEDALVRGKCLKELEKEFALLRNRLKAS